MRKELLWAGIIGISFGLIIGFGVWRVHNSISSKNKTTAVSTPQPKSPIEEFGISIYKPSDLDVVTEDSFNFTGITKASTWIIASTDNEDFIAQSTEDGSFEIGVDLAAGVNHVKLTAIGPDGQTANQKIMVVYSPSFEDAENKDDDSSLKQPKSYLGTVTDISDSTIQIEGSDSQIQQIATSKYEVTAINTTGKTSKNVKLTDIGIGDYIIAMGYTNGNKVLDATRILVANDSTPPEIATSLAKVTKLTGKSLDVVNFNGGETATIIPDKRTWIAAFSDGKSNTIKLTDIDIDDMLIVVSEITGTPSITRSILNIKSK